MVAKNVMQCKCIMYIYICIRVYRYTLYMAYNRRRWSDNNCRRSEKRQIMCGRRGMKREERTREIIIIKKKNRAGDAFPARCDGYIIISSPHKRSRELSTDRNHLSTICV
jgi:hypothetical protein